MQIDAESGLSPRNPRILFEGPYLLSAATFPFYDISPDGERLLMLKPVESQTSAPTQIHVVLKVVRRTETKKPLKHVGFTLHLM